MMKLSSAFGANCSMDQVSILLTLWKAKCLLSSLNIDFPLSFITSLSTSSPGGRSKPNRCQLQLFRWHLTFVKISAPKRLILNFGPKSFRWKGGGVFVFGHNSGSECTFWWLSSCWSDVNVTAVNPGPHFCLRVRLSKAVFGWPDYTISWS